MPGELTVAQLFEAGEGGVGAKEDVDAVEGVGVGFVLALDELAPFGVLLDFAEFEGHRGVGGGGRWEVWEVRGEEMVEGRCWDLRMRLALLLELEGGSKG